MAAWLRLRPRELRRLRIPFLPGSGSGLIPVRTHMGHSHADHHPPGPADSSSSAAADRVTRWGLWSDIALTIGKGGAGAISGSTAILADAAHSLSDVVLSGIALWSLKAARAPKDPEHPYGHGKFETIGALGISGMLLVTGGGIAWHAIEVLQVLLPSVASLEPDAVLEATTQHFHHGHGGHHHGVDMEHQAVALSAAIVSIGVKEGLYWLTKHAGETTGSQLLKANAWHHRSDAVSSLVALVGVGGAILGMPFLDPLAGLLVSGMIVKAGLQCGYQSLQELVDKGVAESVLSPIRDIVLSVEGVMGCHDLRGRRMGSSLHLDVHIEVNPWLSVSAAHGIGEAVRRQLQTAVHNIAESYIHIEPAPMAMAAAAGKLGLHGDKANHLALGDSGTGSMTNKCANLAQIACTDDSNVQQQPEVEKNVRNVLGARFQKSFSVEHVRCHFLLGRVVVEVDLSMDPQLCIKEAMAYAHDAEQALLQSVQGLSAVTMQLRLTTCVQSQAA